MPTTVVMSVFFGGGSIIAAVMFVSQCFNLYFGVKWCAVGRWEIIVLLLLSLLGLGEEPELLEAQLPTPL
jgi:uncharacterized membrane protein